MIRLHRLILRSIKLSSKNISVPILNIIINWILIEALKWQLHFRLMRELLSAYDSFCTGKHTYNLYEARDLELKLKSIFFYLHDMLGKLDLELTYLIFLIKFTTFQNWIK